MPALVHTEEVTVEPSIAHVQTPLRATWINLSVVVIRIKADADRLPAGTMSGGSRLAGGSLGPHSSGTRSARHGIGLPGGVLGSLVVEGGTPSAAVCGCFGAIAAALHAAPAASLPA